MVRSCDAMERKQFIYIHNIIFKIRAMILNIFESVVSITHDIERKSLLVWRTCSRNLEIDKSSVT
jgi:hypothetical protein